MANNEQSVLHLKADLNTFAEKVQESVEKVQRSVAIELHRDIMRGNPVLTGFSRSNWNISIGKPDFTIRGTRQKGASYAMPGSTIGTPKDGQPIYIANGVNYVRFLEYGTTKMPPVGFIRGAIGKMETKIAGIIASHPE